MYVLVFENYLDTKIFGPYQTKKEAWDEALEEIREWERDLWDSFEGEFASEDQSSKSLVEGYYERMQTHHDDVSVHKVKRLGDAKDGS